jgi:hypothetical protein
MLTLRILTTSSVATAAMAVKLEASAATSGIINHQSSIINNKIYGAERILLKDALWSREAIGTTNG